MFLGFQSFNHKSNFRVVSFWSVATILLVIRCSIVELMKEVSALNISSSFYGIYFSVFFTNLCEVLCTCSNFLLPDHNFDIDEKALHGFKRRI